MEELLCCLRSKPKYLSFSFPEVASLAALENVSLSQLLCRYMPEIEGKSEDQVSEEFSARCRLNPALYLSLPSVETAYHMLSRSVCIEKFIRVFGSGASIDSLIESLVQHPNAQFQALAKDPENSFAFYIDYFNETITLEEQVKIIDKFEPIQLAGNIDLRNPKLRFWVIRDMSQTFFFGIEAAKLGRKRFYSKYNLSEREYLGPTSTDNELAFLMANEGLVQSGSMVLDPFVGTGSLLVTAQHFGALCFGSDIDMRVLKGMSVGRSTKSTKADIFTNFKNYGLSLPEIIRCDNSQPAWGLPGVFDSVICDPPYGIRARSRTAGTKSAEMNYIPDTNQYESGQLVQDLLEMAAGLLRIGGRLVFLLPTERALYNKSNLPKHPAFRLIANSENVLSRKIARRLLTMERTAEPQDLEQPTQSDFYSGIRKVWLGEQRS